MTNSKISKKALLISTISLILCFAMLTGTTFAWFTDQETSGNNQIIAGNLDVALYHQSNKMTTKETVAGATDLFNDVTPERWEPGAMAVETFTVVNEGNLALKYELTMNVTDTTTSKNKEFTELLQIAVVEGKVDNTARIDPTDTTKYDWKPFESFSTDEVKLYPDGFKVDENDTNTYVKEKEFSVIVWWKPSDVDNDFNMNNDKKGQKMSTNFYIKLVATQLDAELDAFGDDYDEKAEYPLFDIAFIDPPATPSFTLKAGDVETVVPAGLEDGEYRLTVNSKSVTTDDTTGETTVAYEIDLTRDNTDVAHADYVVSINVGPMLDVTALTHDGNPITVFDYNPITGIITFITNSFSPFAVTYKELDTENVTVADGKITGGVFKGVDPVKIDATLAEADSEYIAVSYTAGEETCYVVSERANTVVLAAPDTVYTPEYDNYTVKTVAAGKLYAEISALQNKEFSTVYLLPGTYNEATTVYVYSSMDIIGLGDKDSVKVIKQSSSGSNRHLFNCNGTKADYIEVTLRNLYLDATAKTTNSKDNAAVQSIRKSKVKCYDLTVVKGTGWDAVAFYVNGNNAVDGVKYPAYMYVENCNLNTTRTFGVVTTSGSYKFYHNGLTYNNGTAYTNNSGSNKNVVMDENDWEW